MFSGEVCRSLATTLHWVQDLRSSEKLCADNRAQVQINNENDKWETKYESLEKQNIELRENVARLEPVTERAKEMAETADSLRHVLDETKSDLNKQKSNFQALSNKEKEWEENSKIMEGEVQKLMMEKDQMQEHQEGSLFKLREDIGQLTKEIEKARQDETERCNDMVRKRDNEINHLNGEINKQRLMLQEQETNYTSVAREKDQQIELLVKERETYSDMKNSVVELVEQNKILRKDMTLLQSAKQGKEKEMECALKDARKEMQNQDNRAGNDRKEWKSIQNDLQKQIKDANAEALKWKMECEKRIQPSKKTLLEKENENLWYIISDIKSNLLSKPELKDLKKMLNNQGLESKAKYKLKQ